MSILFLEFRNTIRWTLQPLNSFFLLQYYQNRINLWIICCFENTNFSKIFSFSADTTSLELAWIWVSEFWSILWIYILVFNHFVFPVLLHVFTIWRSRAWKLKILDLFFKFNLVFPSNSQKQITENFKSFSVKSYCNNKNFKFLSSNHIMIRISRFFTLGEFYFRLRDIFTSFVY